MTNLDVQKQAGGRRKPSQPRAKERVDRILAATREVLRDVGALELTTVRVAERAGVPVGSVYQYFSNKEALVIALYRTMLGDVREVAAQAKAPRYTDCGWREGFTRLIGDLKAAEAAHGFDPVFLSALRVFPALLEYEKEHAEAMAKVLADLMAQHGSTLSQAEREELALQGYCLDAGLWVYWDMKGARIEEIIPRWIEATLTLIEPAFQP